MSVGSKKVKNNLPERKATKSSLPSRSSPQPSPRRGEGEGEIVLYQTEDGKSRIEVRLEHDTVWLTQRLMAELFQTTVANVNTHLKNLYDEGELQLEATIKDCLIVRAEGAREVKRPVQFYNLDAILAVGYRVRSERGTRFRQWATERLREYLVKGFTLDDERLKRIGGGSYFDELLARIRDIRSSEKVFWRKVLDIYATSIDYDPNNDLSREFFAVVQNKMHWAAHGHTAAEIVAARADAAKPHMGLTSWSGSKPGPADAEVAKNYLTQVELDALNRIVTIYLDFAELQALSRKPMYMRQWIGKLNEFLRISERDILTHAGSVSHEQALAKARQEYEKYRKLHADDVSAVERHFTEAVKEVKALAKKPRARRRTRK